MHGSPSAMFDGEITGGKIDFFWERGARGASTMQTFAIFCCPLPQLPCSKIALQQANAKFLNVKPFFSGKMLQFRYISIFAGKVLNHEICKWKCKTWSSDFISTRYLLTISLNIVGFFGLFINKLFFGQRKVHGLSAANFCNIHLLLPPPQLPGYEIALKQC